MGHWLVGGGGALERQGGLGAAGCRAGGGQWRACMCRGTRQQGGER